MTESLKVLKKREKHSIGWPERFHHVHLMYIFQLSKSNVYFVFVFLFSVKEYHSWLSLSHQICVSSEDEGTGFIRVASGKKRGFVPCDVLDIIWGGWQESEGGVHRAPEGRRGRRYGLLMRRGAADVLISTVDTHTWQYKCCFVYWAAITGFHLLIYSFNKSTRRLSFSLSFNEWSTLENIYF